MQKQKLNSIKLFSILIFVFISVFINAQSINEVNYKIFMKEDLNTKMDPQIKNRIEDINKAINQIECRLVFNNQFSVFKQIKKLGIDDNDLSHKIASVFVNGDYYVDLDNKNKMIQKWFSDELFNISIQFKSLEWEITKETKQIGKYLCYKATSIRYVSNSISNTNKEFTTTVWFTPEIPFPFGPQGMDGLPGLVLEATQDDKMYYYASEIKLNIQNENSELSIPKKGTLISETDYSKLVKSKSKYLFED
ncbi:GLPGLI family protein [Xanthomarina sp. F2636L]|uniref:GLPGLI family protein n=1 Tax=Xanthomarina sp. F2636L TaxID=2996018 RepID=UPI00225E4309|nr:GLPGLI family protein [Xanthomarina sp. F2636L]MCX7551392.1 GLPGLI family protein [Xanthomarina sp. F2636L]